jgi:hypothetical protein
LAPGRVDLFTCALTSFGHLPQVVLLGPMHAAGRPVGTCPGVTAVGAKREASIGSRRRVGSRQALLHAGGPIGAAPSWGGSVCPTCRWHRSLLW